MAWQIHVLKSYEMDANYVYVLTEWKPKTCKRRKVNRENVEQTLFQSFESIVSLVSNPLAS